MSDAEEAVPDFSHVEKQKLDGKEAWFELPCVAPNARVRGVCADPSTNMKMAAAEMELSARSYPRPGEDAEGSLRRRMAEQIDLFADHVLTGWDGVVNAAGTVVPFSKRSARALLKALPAHILTSLLNFFLRPRAFSAAIDVEAIAGNSHAGSSGS